MQVGLCRPQHGFREEKWLVDVSSKIRMVEGVTLFQRRGQHHTTTMGLPWGF